MALVKADGNAGLLLDFLGHRGGGRWSMSSMEVRTSNSNLRKYLSPLERECGSNFGWAWRPLCWRLMPEVAWNLAAATNFGSGLLTPPLHTLLSINCWRCDPSSFLLVDLHTSIALHCVHDFAVKLTFWTSSCQCHFRSSEVSLHHSRHVMSLPGQTRS